MLGAAHVSLAIASLALGAVMLLRRKGGRLHRLLGYLYAGALLLVNAAALLVYEDSSGPGTFHVLALVSLATLAAGFVPAFLRRPADSWLEAHARFMSWSYVGLVAAGAGQLATKIAGPGALPVVIPIVLCVAAGAVLIHSRIPGALSRLAFGEASVAKRAPPSGR